MQLAAHELYDLSELAMSCVNSITSMGMFIKSAQDNELKSMIERHLPSHIQDYNMKVEFLSNANGSTQKLNVQNMSTASVSAASALQPVMPRTDAQTMNDREIATAYLLTLKRAGREYAWAAMEMGNPIIREFVKDAFTMSCNHAYEVWQWMVKKGYYPLEQAQQSSLDKIGAFYQEVRTPVMV